MTTLKPALKKAHTKVKLAIVSTAVPALLLTMIVSLAACADSTLTDSTPTNPPYAQAVTREVPVTREAEVTRQVPVTRIIEVTRAIPVTKIVEVIREEPAVEATPTPSPTSEPELTRQPISVMEFKITSGDAVTHQINGKVCNLTHGRYQLQANWDYPNSFIEYSVSSPAWQSVYSAYGEFHNSTSKRLIKVRDSHLRGQEIFSGECKIRVGVVQNDRFIPDVEVNVTLTQIYDPDAQHRIIQPTPTPALAPERPYISRMDLEVISGETVDTQTKGEPCHLTTGFYQLELSWDHPGTFAYFQLGNHNVYHTMVKGYQDHTSETFAAAFRVHPDVQGDYERGDIGDDLLPQSCYIRVEVWHAPAEPISGVKVAVTIKKIRN